MKKPVSIVLLLLFIISPVMAEIYKGVDSEGRVVYSDKETPDAKIIPTPSPNTVQMPKALPKQAAEEVSAGVGYTSFSITSPRNNATIRSNEGDLTLKLSLEPALDLEQGHSISVLLDGRPFIKKSTQLDIVLRNIDRGSHSVKARVRDRQGKSLISSNSLRFHMKRLSSQHKEPAGTPAGPSRSDGTSFTRDRRAVASHPGR